MILYMRIRAARYPSTLCSDRNNLSLSTKKFEKNLKLKLAKRGNSLPSSWGAKSSQRRCEYLAYLRRAWGVLALHTYLVYLRDIDLSYAIVTLGKAPTPELHTIRDQKSLLLSRVRTTGIRDPTLPVAKLFVHCQISMQAIICAGSAFECNGKEAAFQYGRRLLLGAWHHGS
jgi:hypothetical protein